MNFDNFHDATDADFKRVLPEDLQWHFPDRLDAPISCPSFVSRSGSIYCDTGSGVIRLSDHWNLGIRSCNWFLGGKPHSGLAYGYCAYGDFKPAGQHPVLNAFREAQRNTWLLRRFEESERNRRLSTPGSVVSAVRTVLERRGPKKFDEVRSDVEFTVARATDEFVVTTNGERFKKSTIELKPTEKHRAVLQWGDGSVTRLPQDYATRASALKALRSMHANPQPVRTGAQHDTTPTTVTIWNK